MDFQKAYHGHVFMDKQGNEGRAFVEFAPFQKVPRDQRKADTKQGTIEDGKSCSAILWTGNSRASTFFVRLKKETEKDLTRSFIPI